MRMRGALAHQTETVTSDVQKPAKQSAPRSTAGLQHMRMHRRNRLQCQHELSSAGVGDQAWLVNTVFQQFLKTVKNSDVPPSPAHATPPLRTPVILLTLNFRHNGSIPGRQPLMRQTLHNIYTQRETFHIAVYPAEIETSPAAACLQANTSRFQNIWTARHDFAVHQHRDRPKHSHHRNSSAAPNLLAVCPTLTAQLTNAHFCRAINLFVVWGQPILSAAFQRLRKSYSFPSFPTTAKSPLSDKIIIAP